MAKMIQTTFQTHTKIDDFPFEHVYKKELGLLEDLNPCQQTYYGTKDAFVLRYRQKLNLFNFINGLSLRKEVSIVGMPLSMAMAGYEGPPVQVADIIESLPGLTLVLNARDDLPFSKAHTLSCYDFVNRFTSFDDYLNALRSPYRYRIKKAIKKGSQVLVRPLRAEAFSDAHYTLYKTVYDRSEDKLECLSKAFFQTFPGDLYEFVDKESGKVLAFVQVQEIEKPTVQPKMESISTPAHGAIADQKKGSKDLIFLFGGFDPDYQRSHDIYWNMLLTLVKIGIDRGVDRIQMGQTAGDTKLKLGCEEVPKYLYVHHGNPLIQGLVARLLPLLSYKPFSQDFHPWRQP